MVKKLASPVFESDRVLLMRRNRWIMVASMSPCLAACALTVAGIWVEPESSSYAPHLALCGMALAFFAYQSNWRPSSEAALVRAGPEGVTIGRRVIRRARIRAGLAMPGIAPRLFLRRWLWFPVELQTTSRAEARALLCALGLDASQVAVDFRGLSRLLLRPSHAPGAALALFLLGLASAHAPALGRAIAIAFSAIIVFAFLVPTRLRVGTDGVALRWLWLRRFIGYAEIDDVTRYEDFGAVGLDIQTRAGHVHVPMGLRLWIAPMTLRSPGVHTFRDTEIALAWERIREAVLTFAPRLTSQQDNNAEDAASAGRTLVEDEAATHDDASHLDDVADRAGAPTAPPAARDRDRSSKER